MIGDESGTGDGGESGTVDGGATGGQQTVFAGLESSAKISESLQSGANIWGKDEEGRGESGVDTEEEDVKGRTGDW